MTNMTRRMALAGAAGLAAGGRATAAGGGFDPGRLAAIRPALEQAIAAGAVPGMVTLTWRKGQPLQANAVGVRDIARNLPMTRNAIFRIASMSKPITVAAALMLVERGRMRLEDPITRWAPEFANMRVLRRPNAALDDTYPTPRAITVEDLMTHRAGFSYGFTSPGPIGAALMAKFNLGIDSPMSPDAWMKAMAELPLLYAPGERFNYGHSTDVLGFIVGRAAGSDLRRFLREEMFGPLRMTDTDFWIPPAKRDRIATPYSSPAPKVFDPAPIPSFEQATPPAYTSGGQGLVSTADDYMTFARMLLGGGAVGGVRVLKSETVAMMTANRLTPAQRQIPAVTVGISWKSQGFGLGVTVITDGEGYSAGPGAGSTGAFSWPGAFGGYWQADPARELVWIWLQEVLPAAPAPGTFPRLPGLDAMRQFQKLTYAALT